jgi:hypothetical protein
VLRCLTKEVLRRRKTDEDAEAVIQDDDAMSFWRTKPGNGSQEFKVGEWDGDDIIHEAGRRFEVYELIKD